MHLNYQQRRRKNTAQAMNPIMCKADYFKHKLHLDQNETLVMYGEHTLQRARSSYRWTSDFLICHTTMHTTMLVLKNLVIFEDAFLYLSFLFICIYEHAYSYIP